MNLKQFLILNNIKKKVFKKLASAEVYCALSNEPIPFKKINSLNFVEMKKGEVWSGKPFGCAWFLIKGDIGQGVSCEYTYVRLNIRGEGLAYDKSGNAIEMISSTASALEKCTFKKQFIPLNENTCKDGRIDFLVDAGFNSLHGKARLATADICLLDRDCEKLYYDYMAVALKYFASGKDGKAGFMSALDKAYALFLKDKTIEASEVLQEFLEGKNENAPIAYAVGHAHLDLAWLWPIRETRRKFLRTITNALNRIDADDEYIFGISQPQLLEWLEEDSPKLFERVKAAAKNGRIELQGGMWVESDCNLVSGESLVRQIMYGQEYYKKNFGFVSDYCWLPDVFGFNGNLAQILEKCGLKSFSTIKLSWNKHNKFPHTSFVWKGIDNKAEVVAHFPPEGNYVSNMTPNALVKADENNIEREIAPDFLVPFGIGDGGGGPSNANIQLAKRLKSSGLKTKTGRDLPRVKFSSVKSFFDELQKKKDTLPVYQGELYLEFHQGTYTTQAKNKWFNRKAECLLHGVEFLATKKFLQGGDYPQKDLEKAWKEVLLYQFHDILPGSSIARVYEETDMGYGEIFRKVSDMRAKLLEAPSKKLTFINPTSFNRAEWLAYDNKWFKVEIPPFSAVGAEYKKVEDYNFSYSKTHIENNKIKIEFAKDGGIKSIYDKVSHKDVCKGKMNNFVMYPDLVKSFNAWNISERYDAYGQSSLAFKRFKTFVDGPMIMRQSVFTHGKTSIVQNIILLWGEDYIRFDTQIKWFEKDTMLRVEFEPNVGASEVRCDIQFGNIMRSTKEDTPERKAQFEVCAHKFVDVEDDDYGFALLNDCKYGHRVKNGKISLNLLRATNNPAKKADIGTHSLSYIVYPHKEKFAESRVTSLAYALNNPLMVSEFDGEFKSLASVTDERVVIETIKKAQNGNAVVLRAYENTGEERKTKIKIDFEYIKAFEANMLEEKTSEIDIENEITFAPFESKTFVFER